MKKALFTLLTMLAFTGMALAQDVYSSGYYYNSDYEKVAVVYKNGDLLYSTGNTPSYNHDSPAVLYLEGDVYWVDNCLVSNYDNYYSRVMKNDQVFLEIPVGLYPYITCLFTNGVDVYAGGYIRVNSYQKAMVWKNSDATPYLTFDAVNYSYGRLKDAMIVEGKVFACGDVYDTDLNATVGVIWHEDYGQLYSLGEGVVPLSMDYYDGSVYSATWDLNNNAGIVFQDDYELYTLTTNGNADVICIDAGDVYVGIYDQDQVWGSIWKNNEKVYDVSYHYGTECLVVNSEGVFYVADGGVWKNGSYLFSLDDDPSIQGMYVDLDCQNNAIRTLPYYESFETGATDWTCWHVRDFDNQNDDNASYWHRGGENFEVNPPDGHHCAWHRYNSEFHQNGTLTSPPISIPVGGSVTMTFKTYEEWPGDYDYEGVWVATEGNDDEVWVQTEPSAEWKKVTIDLTAYQGQVVTIEFDYEGTDAHSWYIDDVYITQAIGVEENDTSTDSYAVYPNPACDRVRIEGLEACSEVQLINAIGELVKTVKVDADSEIGIAELASGLYLVRCGNTNLRFVKE